MSVPVLRLFAFPLIFAAPEFSEAWRRHALTNRVVERLIELRLAPRAHTLRAFGLDPGVVLEGFELAFAGAALARDADQPSAGRSCHIPA